MVLHLIHRRKAREVRFSTLRFLRVSVQRTRRRKYVEDLSLLIVRAAVLLLIAAGLARPSLVESGRRSGAADATSAIAIVLDNSASMAVTADGRHPVRDRPARGRGDPRRACARAISWPCCRPEARPPRVRPALPHPRDRAAGPRPVPAQLRARGPRRQDPASRRLCWPGPRLPARKFTSSPTTRVFPGTASRSRSPRMIRRTPSRPPGAGARGPGQRPGRSGAQRGPQDDHPGQPGAGGRRLVSGDRRGLEYRDGTPAEARGAAHRRRDRESVSPTLTLLPRARQARLPVHPGPAGGPSGRGPARRGGRLLPGQPALLHGHASTSRSRWRSSSRGSTRSRWRTTRSIWRRALAPGGSTGGAFRIATLTPESLATESLSGYAVVFCVNFPALAPPGGREAPDLRPRRAATSSGSAAATSSPWTTTR